MNSKIANELIQRGQLRRLVRQGFKRRPENLKWVHPLFFYKPNFLRKKFSKKRKNIWARHRYMTTNWIE
uniref:Ribosomal protein S19 n=1 Tax=Romanomermis culicivorax TaxID=13658 RepID=A0A915KUA8_ROMCU